MYRFRTQDGNIASLEVSLNGRRVATYPMVAIISGELRQEGTFDWECEVTGRTRRFTSTDITSIHRIGV